MRQEPIFADRADAGKKLANAVRRFVSEPAVLVWALPRGGVPVGFEVAQALRTELDVFVVRKLGMPGQEELAIGAIASGGVRVLNESLIKDRHLSVALIDRITAREEMELARREELYRSGQPITTAQGRVVILVDDGLATGASMRAACRALRQHRPRRIVVAVPVGAQQTCAEINCEADQVICAETPEPFIAVGAWYESFPQTADEEVRELLRRAAQDYARVKSSSS